MCTQRSDFRRKLTQDREKLHCLPTDGGRPWFILSQATLYSLAVTAQQLSTTYFCLSFISWQDMRGRCWSHKKSVLHCVQVERVIVVSP